MQSTARAVKALETHRKQWPDEHLASSPTEDPFSADILASLSNLPPDTRSSVASLIPDATYDESKDPDGRAFVKLLQNHDSTRLARDHVLDTTRIVNQVPGTRDVAVKMVTFHNTNNGGALPPELSGGDESRLSSSGAVGPPQAKRVKAREGGSASPPPSVSTLCVLNVAGRGTSTSAAVTLPSPLLIPPHLGPWHFPQSPGRVPRHSTSASSASEITSIQPLSVNSQPILGLGSCKQPIEVTCQRVHHPTPSL